MKKDEFLRIMLVIIALLFLLNLFIGRTGFFGTKHAGAASAQKLSYRGNGVGIACSSDGRYVFAAGSGSILRSSDYGSAGSWEVVVAD